MRVRRGCSSALCAVALAALMFLATALCGQASYTAQVRGVVKDQSGAMITRATITITNCTMLHGHGELVIGSEMSGGVRHVAIPKTRWSTTSQTNTTPGRLDRVGIAPARQL